MFRLLIVAAALATTGVAQTAPGQLTRVKVHGVGLEGNLAGDSPDRDVTVYLPPSYAKSAGRRYPVLYLLHGFTDSDEKWMWSEKHFIRVPAVADRVFAAGAAKEMIIVMPNAFTKFEGSMYTSSVVNGDWEGFVGKELVDYIDSRYRTIARPESRGLAGHSMGGYGALRIAMKRPGVFSSIYSLSPCCLMPGSAQGTERAAAVKSHEEIASLPFGVKAQLAGAAAWSPNPDNPPLYIDLPMKNGEVQPQVLGRWAANAPVMMVDQYIWTLKQLKAIAIDMGDKDGLMLGAKELDRILSSRHVPHTFETYDGNHVNHVSDRMEQKVLPFFSQHLSFATGR